MRFTKKMKVAQFFNSMSALGFSYDEADKLRLIEKTLQGWAELECGDGNEYGSYMIERDEQTDKPYMVREFYRNGGLSETHRSSIRDREKGALKRLDAIMAAHPELVRYHQTDPRGCALYIVRKSDLNGLNIDSVYTRGFGVCID